MDEDLIIPQIDEDCASIGDHHPEPTNFQDELEQFRTEWKRELQVQHQRIPGNSQPDEQSLLKEATRLFLQGIQLEQDGLLYEAIAFYRRAMQLVPDIESKIDFLSSRNSRERQDSETSLDGSHPQEEIEEDLVTHFQKLNVNENSICGQAVEQRVTHISCLPVELLIYIFKWVVSNDLDLKSLEVLSQVCRGFYLCARDEEVWKLACHRVWGENCKATKKYGGSWRKMFIEKPHLHYNGCYISKVTYVRQGEQSMDMFYRPFQLVEYFRLIRFFPEGTVLMLCSPEELGTLVPRLKSRTCKVQGLLRGYYRISKHKVTAVLKREKVPEITTGYRYRRQHRQQVNQNEGEQSFYVEFDLQDSGKHPHYQLVWKSYSVRTLYKATGHENIAEFELTKKAYPPLIFSRVKSYTMISEKPLE